MREKEREATRLSPIVTMCALCKHRPGQSNCQSLITCECVFAQMVELLHYEINNYSSFIINIDILYHLDQILVAAKLLFKAWWHSLRSTIQFEATMAKLTSISILAILVLNLVLIPGLDAARGNSVAAFAPNRVGRRGGDGDSSGGSSSGRSSSSGGSSGSSSGGGGGGRRRMRGMMRRMRLNRPNNRRSSGGSSGSSGGSSGGSSQ